MDRLEKTAKGKGVEEELEEEGETPRIEA